MTNGEPCSAALVIATYGRHELVGPLVDSVLQLAEPPSEFVIVDQPHPATGWLSLDNTLTLRAQTRNVDFRVLRQEQANLPLARNLALHETTADIIIFVDDDVVLESEIVREHVAGYDDRATSGLGGRITGPMPWPPDEVRDGDTVASVIGCNMSFRRDVLESLGGFDPGFAPCCFGEDNDVSNRIRAARGVLRFRARAQLQHLKLASGGDRLNRADSAYHRSYVRNMTHIAIQRRGWLGGLSPLQHPRWWLGRGSAIACARGWWDGVRQRAVTTR